MLSSVSTMPGQSHCAARESSSVLEWLTLWTILTSFLVLWEPAPSDVFFVLTFTGAVLTARMPARPTLWPVAAAGMAIFAAGNLISLRFIENVSAGLQFCAVSVYLLLLWVWLVTLIAQSGPRFAERLRRAYCWAALAAASIGVLARFGVLKAQIFFRDESGLRIQATFKDPNVFAPFVVGGVLLMLGGLVERRERTLPGVVAMSVLLLGVLFAFSRGAYAHLFLSLVVFGGLYLVVAPDSASRGRMLRIFGAAALLGTLAVVWLLVAGDLGGYFKQRLSLQSYDTKRFATQGLAIELIGDYPWGMGPGQWVKGRFLQATHNTYARVVSENGLLGLVGLVTFFAANLGYGISYLRGHREHRALVCACLAVSIGILGESMVIDTLHWRHFYFFLAIPTGLLCHGMLRPARGLRR